MFKRYTSRVRRRSIRLPVCLSNDEKTSGYKQRRCRTSALQRSRVMRMTAGVEARAESECEAPRLLSANKCRDASWIVTQPVSFNRLASV
jgi:hypothetical protein